MTATLPWARSKLESILENINWNDEGHCIGLADFVLLFYTFEDRNSLLQLMHSFWEKSDVNQIPIHQPERASHNFLVSLILSLKELGIQEAILFWRKYSIYIPYELLQTPLSKFETPEVNSKQSPSEKETPNPERKLEFNFPSWSEIEASMKKAGVVI